MTTATGWAILDNGRINVATVSPNRRGAMVNWLLVVRQMLFANTAPDEVIEQIWWREHGTAEIWMVRIESMKQ
jgi:hypothetical protein